MKKVVFVVAVVVVMALVGTFLVGRFVMSAGSSALSPVSYTSPTVMVSPEWEAFQHAKEKGEEGLGELKELMNTPDDAVAARAALELFGAGEDGALMFFDKLPEVSAGVKNYLRSDTYNDWQFKLAWKKVAGPDGATRDGAALFLRLPYSQTYLDSTTLSGIGDTLVEAIPGANGSFADDLAFTIGLYPPSSLDELKKHLGSDEPQVRLLAVQALGRLGDEAVLGEVKRMRYDGAVKVREAAYAAAAGIEAAVNKRALAASRARLAQADPEEARKNAKKRLGMP